MALSRMQWHEMCIDGFLESCSLLKQIMDASPSIVAIPLAVNAAFACEIAIKRVIEIRSGNQVRGHNLRNLWGQIDAPDQSMVIPLVCKAVPLAESRFDEYLDKCSETFEDFRYAYESPVGNFTNLPFLICLAKELRKVR